MFTAKCCCGGSDGNGKGGVLRRYATSSAVATLYFRDDSGLPGSRYAMTAIYLSNLRTLCHDAASNCLPKNELFDVSSLSDAVLSPSYTAREGGYGLRKKVEWKACGCGNGVWRGFEVRREFPEGAGVCCD